MQAQLQAALRMLTEVQQENADLDTQKTTKNCRAMSLSAKAVLDLLQQILSNIPAAGVCCLACLLLLELANCRQVAQVMSLILLIGAF